MHFLTIFVNFFKTKTAKEFFPPSLPLEHVLSNQTWSLIKKKLPFPSQTFYLAHKLYYAYFTLMIFHAPSCWHWLLVPGLIFILELLYRLLTQCSGFRGKSNVTAGIVLPSKVTGLVIKKPAGFTHTPGESCESQCIGNSSAK